MGRHYSAVSIITFLAVIGSGCGPAQDGEPGGKRYIVKIRDSFDLQTIQPSVSVSPEQGFMGVLSAPGAKAPRTEYLGANTYLLRYAKDNSDAEQEAARISENSDVEYVEEDIKYYAVGMTNDPSAGQQWAHNVVKSYQAFDVTMGSQDVIVGVIDSGIDYTHVDLKNNMWKNPGETPGNGVDDDHNGLIDDVVGYDFANNDSDPIADDHPQGGHPGYHGTHVAGTIGAEGNNNIGVVGHSPRVKLMALKFLGGDGSGSVSSAIRAIDYAISKGARILSNSWGGPQASQALSDAIERARTAGILFVVAAGNGGQDGVGDNNDSTANYPSNYTHDNILAVAATKQNDQLTSFSNFGANSVDVGAPGEQIYSTKNGNQYQFMSGTSMATPLVSGVAALMLAVEPKTTYQGLRNAIMNTVDKVTSLQGKVASGGRINAYKAVMAVKNGDVPTQPDPPGGPTPDPGTPPSGIAKAPMLNGQPQLVMTNPTAMLSISYDVSEYPQAYGVYIEFSKPGGGFSNPNGQTPDPYRQTYIMSAGLSNTVNVRPVDGLPGWGVYQIRVIPLTQQSQPVAGFSHPSALTLRPF